MYLTQEQANDKDLIRYLAEQAISENIQTIYPLKSGVSSNSYEINHHLIFKLPNFRTPLEKWNEQSQCAPVLQKYLDLQIPQPQLKTVFLSSSDQFSLLASVHEKIPGHVISCSRDFFEKDASFKQRYFEQLATFVHQLHSIDSHILPIEMTKAEIFL